MSWVKAHKVWTAVIAIVLIGLIGGASGGEVEEAPRATPASSSESSPEPKDEKPEKETLPRGDEWTAQVMCEEFVGDKLKAASTAEFFNQQHKVTGKHWFVWGEVSAENSYGGTVDMAYSCLLDETKEDGVWHAKSVMVS